MRRFLQICLTGVAIATSTVAIAQVQVIPECVALAQREGYPTDYLTDQQAKRAKLKLQWLRVRHPFDPEVRGCWTAVKRYREQMKN